VIKLLKDQAGGSPKGLEIISLLVLKELINTKKKGER
jgi:hypothetical protein